MLGNGNFFYNSIVICSSAIILSDEIFSGSVFTKTFFTFSNLIDKKQPKVIQRIRCYFIFVITITSHCY